MLDRRLAPDMFESSGDVPYPGSVRVLAKQGRVGERLVVGSIDSCVVAPVGDGDGSDRVRWWCRNDEWGRKYRSGVGGAVQGVCTLSPSDGLSVLHRAEPRRENSHRQSQFPPLGHARALPSRARSRSSRDRGPKEGY